MASDIERGQYGNKESFKLKFNSIVKVMNSAVELLNLIYFDFTTIFILCLLMSDQIQLASWVRHNIVMILANWWYCGD